MTRSGYISRRIGSMALGLALGLCVLLAWGCGGSTPPPTTNPGQEKVHQPIFGSTQPAEDKPATFESISYLRTGGFAYSEVRILVSPDGSYVLNDTRNGQHLGHLTKDQMASLAEAFDVWKKLDEAYMPKGTVADDYRYQVRYGSKTVTASEAAESLPESVKKAIRQLEVAVEIKTGK